MIISKNSNIDENTIIDEATGYETMKFAENVPEDFRKTVLKAVDKGIELTNGKGVGEGPKDAFFGTFFRHFKNTKKRISDNALKKAYVLIVPQKIRIKPDMYGFNCPEEYVKIAEAMMKAAGMKKGQKLDGFGKDAAYWYKESSDKKCLYVGWFTSPSSYFVVKTQLQIVFRCCENSDYMKSFVESATPLDEVKKSYMDTDTLTIYDDPEENKENIEDDSADNLYRDPVYNKAVMEYFDMTDKKTRSKLLSMNEAGQNSILMNLTSKLYDKIVEKVDEIDYGEIPNSKGDITKLSKYESMKETIAIMHDILREYKQDSSPVDELSVALSNIESRKDLFGRAFRYNVELPIVMYNNVVLGIITGISYMIATCIEFVKDPGTNNFRISLDKLSYAKTKEHMIYSTLKTFNKSCEKGDFDKAMEAIIKANIKNFTGAAIVGGIAIGVIGSILVLIPVLRELIFLFYYNRMKVSDFFDIQADLLQMNAYSIEANSTLSKDEQQKVMAKQLKYVDAFRKISNKFAIDMKKAEISSDKEKRNDDENKMLISDIEDELETDGGASALF